MLFLGAFHYGVWLCQIPLLLALLDVLVPLKSPPHGYWAQWANLCDVSKGEEQYNDAEVIVEGEGGYDRSKNYLLCYMPHSLYMYCLWTIRRYFIDKHGISVFFTGADVIFQVPIWRRIMTWWGCTRVSAEAMKKTLQIPFPHNVLLLSPDGIAGMFYGIEHEQCVLHRRRGFCRIALQTGASLVPCYILGANELYFRKFGPASLAAKISHNLHFSMVYWTGRFGVPFGFLPRPQKLVVALGSPIDVVKTEQPTKEEIDALHEKFTVAVKMLFDKHKHRMGREWVGKRDRLYLETEQPPSHMTKKVD